MSNRGGSGFVPDDDDEDILNASPIIIHDRSTDRLIDGTLGQGNALHHCNDGIRDHIVRMQRKWEAERDALATVRRSNSRLTKR